MKKIYFLLCLLLLANGIVAFGQLAVFYEGFATEANFNGWISTHDPAVTSRDWTRVDESLGLGKPDPAPVGETWGVWIAGGFTDPFDSWLIRRQAAHLTAGKTYTILFYSKSNTNSAPTIELMIGKSSNISDLKKLSPVIRQQLTSGWINPYMAFYKPDTDGDYYFAFHGYSTRTANQFLVLDEIEVAVSDAGVTAITAPTDDVSLSSACDVTVTVKNFGGRALSKIPITYTVNGGTPVETEYVPGPLAVGAEVSYTFTAKANLSAHRDYVIKAYTLLPGDTDASNDATTVTLSNTASVYDYGVTAITAPASGINTTDAAEVTVTVKNFGENSLSNIPVTYMVNSRPPVVTEYVPGSIASGEETSYTFNTKADLSVAGEYLISAHTTVSGDINPANDGTEIRITATDFVPCSTISAPWSESFSGSTFPPSDCWSNTSATNLPWKRISTGTYPACSPYDGDGGMLQYNCYVYTTNSRGLLVLPEVETNKPVNFSFYMYRDQNSAGRDYVNVYISNTPDINGKTPVLTVYRACSLTPAVSSGGWYPYSVVVPAGTKYISLEGVSAHGYNIYVDKLELSEIPDYDAGVVAITAPVSGIDMSDAETVTIKVKNEGLQTLANIPVSFKVDNGSSVAAETVPGPIVRGAETEYTFTAKADLSVVGNHIIKAYTLLENDANRANDTVTVTINTKGSAIPSVSSNVSVYPTLSRGKITVNTAGKATVRIVDLSGNVMATYESNVALDINLPYEDGIYFVRISNEKGHAVYKVILKK